MSSVTWVTPGPMRNKSILAAAIIGVLDDRKLSVRKAEDVIGINASEFSRIRTAQLGRFTVGPAHHHP